MINTNSKIKTTIIICLVLILGLFALPNIYKDDYAIKISSKEKDHSIADIEKTKNLFQKNNIEIKSIVLNEKQDIEVRFFDSEEQLQAKELLNYSKDENESVTLYFARTTPKWLQKINAHPVNLGLDLRGGIHFVMEVETDTIIKSLKESEVRSIKQLLREEKIRYKSIDQQGSKINIELRNTQDTAKTEKTLNKTNKYNIKTKDNYVYVSLPSENIEDMQSNIITQNINIMQKRINSLGVAEPIIQRLGANKITIELPGVQDPVAAKNILKATATLEFKMAENSSNDQNREFLDKKGNKVYLNNNVILTGEHIIDASVGVDEYSRPQVNITLDSFGGNKMSASTRKNVGRPMATVLKEYKEVTTQAADGAKKIRMKKVETVISVATIQSELGNRFVITGLDFEEAKELAVSLRSGALKAPIRIVEEKIVGPTIGKDNIKKGIQAIIIGLVSVMLFMILYYKVFGLIAGITVVINIILILGLVSLIQGATLTMPGIAGMVLTIGMAVDGNILIFERIREEILSNQDPQSAIHKGYENALSTITDANITTFITSIILFAIGTGTVKGFALTLMIGIATSMFTVILVSRIIVNTIYGNREIEKLNI